MLTELRPIHFQIIGRCVFIDWIVHLQKKKKRKFVIWSQFGRVCNCFRWLGGYMAIKMVAIENCILNSVGKWIFDFVVRNVQSKCQCHECTEVFSFSYIWKHLSCCFFFHLFLVASFCSALLHVLPSEILTSRTIYTEWTRHIVAFGNWELWKN